MKILYEQVESNLMSELYDISTNYNKLVKLTEKTLNRLAYGHDKYGYCMISANREDEVDASGNKLTPLQRKQINNANYKELKKLISAKYSFIPAYGGYQETGNPTSMYERSFVVFPTDKDGNVIDFEELKQDMINWGRKFNQEEILIKEPNSNAYYYDCNKNRVTTKFSDKLTLNDLTQIYFTALRKYKAVDEGKPQRITLNTLDESVSSDPLILYTNPIPATYFESHSRYLNNELFLKKIDGD